MCYPIRQGYSQGDQANVQVLKNAFILAEILIDFQELLCEYTGQNMAEVVWETLNLYGLIQKLTELLKISAFVIDNATNNNTMVEVFAEKCYKHHIHFSVKDGRGHCMPHTMHLAALKLFEEIGTIMKVEEARASGPDGYYQDIINAAASEPDNIGPSPDGELVGHTITGAVGKILKIVRVVCSSPQRRQKWFREIDGLNAKRDIQMSKPLLPYILEQAIKYREVINQYVLFKKDLRGCQLDDDQWSELELIASWLQAFCNTTTQILRDIIWELPSSIHNGSPRLFDYFYKFDELSYTILHSLK
ncbi:hypothetical protein FISHEDRAFT_62766 [Fistulina hepatica ATCC 64428]|nr:hypothetical protein FISHEDRAFT_62766 [Fistulina hepatica ATCC 64428]